MSEHVLITGGAGFIGRFVTEELLRRGHRVRILDNLLPQVHGDGGRPANLSAEAELIVADVRDGDAVAPRCARRSCSDGRAVRARRRCFARRYPIAPR